MNILIFITFYIYIMLVYILTVLLSPHSTLAVEKKDIAERISEGVAKLRKSDVTPVSLQAAIADFKRIKNHRRSNKAFCNSCKNVTGQIIDLRKNGGNKSTMADFFKKLCHTFTSWGDVACTGYINIEIDTILYIIDNKGDLTGERVCAISFQERNCQDARMKKWSVDLPASSKRKVKEQSDHANASPLKILHLTDFHFDPLYKPGSNADCGLPLCCQEGNGVAPNPKKAAGYWGDYHSCDMPWHSITNVMAHLNSTYKVDLVYYTGDIISHRSWDTTKDHNVGAIKDLYALLKETFKTVPVYPILGNHEPHPTDFYSPTNITISKLSTQWVFDLAVKEWSRWLPQDTEKTIPQGGYYTLVVRPGFRIVALNSNVCYTSNLWLLYDDEDPYGQLKWLAQVLAKAERNKEKVHILSHIPPGEVTCHRQWAHEFRRIVNRFSSTIVAQFNGHTHLDELRVFYDLDDSNKAVNVAFNAGSFTTFVGFNPNYRLYHVDNSTLRVLDYDHYTYNLTKANLNPSQSPQWYKLYSLKQAYNLQNTQMQDFEDLVQRMTHNGTLVAQYYRFSVRDSDPEMKTGCDEKCLMRLMCSITSVEAKESIQCLEFKKHYHQYKHLSSH